MNRSYVLGLVATATAVVFLGCGGGDLPVGKPDASEPTPDGAGGGGGTAGLGGGGGGGADAPPATADAPPRPDGASPPADGAPPADAAAPLDAAGQSEAAMPPSDAMVSSPDADPARCMNIQGDRETQVCLRWVCDRMNRQEGVWNGSVGMCTAGDMTPAGRANALRMVNLYRFIADLPPVTTDPDRDRRSQQCALMMDANDALSHMPPMSWKCYSADGAAAAGSANISTIGAVQAVDLYMVDPGASNGQSIGHRRWLLSNKLGPMGIGSAGGGSCHYVGMGTGTVTRAWTAWPPPGPIPVGAINLGGFIGSTDQTGWTVQTTNINLANAQVTVKDNGANANVTVTQLLQNYGSKYAIRFNPQGWTSQAGHTYQVSITGISTPINYEVKVVDCN